MSLLDTTRILACPLPASFVPSDEVSIYLREGLEPAAVSELSSVCAIGAFDGVHLGHRALIEAAIADAKNRDALSFAVTFNPDPARILSPEHAESELLCTEDRIRMLMSLGLDGVVCISFTREFAAHSYEEFLTAYLKDMLNCVSVHVGENFHMGAGGKGTPATLGAYAQQFDISVTGHELTESLGHPVSASRIRSLLRGAKIEPATTLLGRPHTVSGTVAHGRGQGTSFGFPTANIQIDEHICLPAEGVYAAWVGTGDHMWPAAVNVGAPRTFGGVVGVPMLEATLLGFEGNLYDTKLFCCFYTWLRAPQHFPTIEKLEKTVLSNIDWVRTNLGEGELSD